MSAVAGPVDILAQLMRDRWDYVQHVPRTIAVATGGLVLGAVVAVLLAVTFLFMPAADRALRGILVSLFGTPLLILALLVDGAFVNRAIAAIVFTTMAVFYPIMENATVALRTVDRVLIDVTRVLGGGPATEFRYIRARYAATAIVTGLQVGWPVALLASMLSEFAGSQVGLGKYLIGSLSLASPPRLWGIATVTSVIAGAGYLLFGGLAARFAQDFKENATLTEPTYEPAVTRRPGSRPLRPLLEYVILPLCAWSLYVFLFRGALSAKSPLDVWHYLSIPPEGWTRVSALMAAIPITLIVGLLGVAASLSVAFGVALAMVYRRALADVLMAPILVTQAVPIIAWIPVLKALLGRGVALTVAVVVSATFFPATVYLYRALTTTPKGAVDVLESYGASSRQILALLRIPAAMPYIKEAVRLTVPRALLGVILAEYLVTARGLGAVVYTARGTVDFTMLWAVTAVTAAFALVLHALARLSESQFSGMVHA